MYMCKFCKKPITRLQRIGYALKNLFENHILFHLELTNFGGGRITDSYWYWKDIKKLSKGKTYFHLGCDIQDYRKRGELAKAKSKLSYYIAKPKTIA